VDLIEVDIVRAEPAQAGVDLAHDRLAGEALAIRARMHLPAHLRRQHELVAVG
jgi:hypothetical protein